MRVVLNRATLENNTHDVMTDGTFGTGSIVVQVRDSVIADSAGHAFGSSGVATPIVLDLIRMAAPRSHDCSSGSMLR